ncbi:MAG TPA: SURF1 family protein [Burkholderiaceae bacterium]|nr:SURF1 family protein [Burkholderiaceae bacterium]
MTLRPSDALVWLGVVVAVAATTRLGIWQLDRAAQKTHLEQSVKERAQLPLLASDRLAREPEAVEAQLHRRVALRGRWLASHTVALDNRPLHGRAGFIITTPLLLAAGDAVLVQRGWAPRDARDRTLLPALDTPSGEVRVDGRIAPWPSHRLELAAAEEGPIRQNLDAAQLAREAGVALRPLSLLQLDGPDARDALVREWPVPSQDVWKHHGYALQWFALCALIAGLTVWYRLIRPRRGQRS